MARWRTKSTCVLDTLLFAESFAGQTTPQLATEPALESKRTRNGAEVGRGDERADSETKQTVVGVLKMQFSRGQNQTATSASTSRATRGKCTSAVSSFPKVDRQLRGGLVIEDRSEGCSFNAPEPEQQRDDYTVTLMLSTVIEFSLADVPSSAA